MEEKLIVSIITTAYNAKSTIETTISSVLNQTYDAIEYIIIDGKSTDGTIEILQKYSNKIKFISEDDDGIYDAMNKALNLATGDFIYFLGADDTFYGNHVVENVVKSITNKDEIYYGDVYMLELHKTYWGKFNRIKLGMGNICHQSIFYPKAVYKNFHYNLKYKIYADYFYNLSLYNKIKFNYVNIIIANFSVLGASQYMEDKKFAQVKKRLVINELGYLAFIASNIYHSLRKLKNIIKGVSYR